MDKNQNENENLNQEILTEKIENQQEVEKLKNDLDLANLESLKFKDLYFRQIADFENFKKRSEKERYQILELLQSNILKDLLTIIDDFDRAFKNKNEENKNFFEGIELIYKSFIKKLDSYSVKEILNYSTFDPMYHEALVQVDSENHKSGEIVEVFAKGFLLKDQILRPAKVSVAK